MWSSTLVLKIQKVKVMIPLVSVICNVRKRQYAIFTLFLCCHVIRLGWFSPIAETPCDQGRRKSSPKGSAAACLFFWMWGNQRIFKKSRKEKCTSEKLKNKMFIRKSLCSRCHRKMIWSIIISFTGCGRAFNSDSGYGSNKSVYVLINQIKYSRKFF